MQASTLSIVEIKFRWYVDETLRLFEASYLARSAGIRLEVCLSIGFVRNWCTLEYLKCRCHWSFDRHR